VAQAASGDAMNVLLTGPGGKPLRKHRRHMDELLAYYAARGTPLSTLAGPMYLRRKVATLRKYVRRLGLAFPDYAPRSRKE